MTRQARRWMTWIATGCWVASLAAVVLCIARPDEVAWRAVGLFVMSAASCATITAILSRTFAPVETTFQLGYDAGWADGLRAARKMAEQSADVIDLHRRRTDVPTGSTNGSLY